MAPTKKPNSDSQGTRFTDRNNLMFSCQRTLTHRAGTEFGNMPAEIMRIK